MDNWNNFWRGWEIVLDSLSIFKWSVGDYSDVKFIVGNRLASAGGFAVGAIIGGGPQPHISTLSSPFVRMVQGNQLYQEWRISINELAKSGCEQQILLQAVN